MMNDHMLNSLSGTSLCWQLQDHTYALRRSLSPPPLLTFDIDDVSCNTTVVTSATDNDVWEGSVTRCICGFQHDDGFMICCDQCSVWQHVVCMGIPKNCIPDVYLCERCNPRAVDVLSAIRSQSKTLKQLADSSTESDNEVDVKLKKPPAKKRVHRMSTKSSDSTTTKSSNVKEGALTANVSAKKDSVVTSSGLVKKESVGTSNENVKKDNVPSSNLLAKKEIAATDTPKKENTVTVNAAAKKESMVTAKGVPKKGNDTTPTTANATSDSMTTQRNNKYNSTENCTLKSDDTSSLSRVTGDKRIRRSSVRASTEQNDIAMQSSGAQSASEDELSPSFLKLTREEKKIQAFMKMFEKLEKTDVNRKETKKLVKPSAKAIVKSEGCKQDDTTSLEDLTSEDKYKDIRKGSNCVVPNRALKSLTAMESEKDKLEDGAECNKVIKTERAASEQTDKEDDGKVMSSVAAHGEKLAEESTKAVKKEDAATSDSTRARLSETIENKSEEESTENLTETKSGATRMSLRNKNSLTSKPNSENINCKSEPSKPKNVSGRNEFCTKNDVRGSTKGKKCVTGKKTLKETVNATKAKPEEESESDASVVAAKDSQSLPENCAQVGSEKNVSTARSAPSKTVTVNSKSQTVKRLMLLSSHVTHRVNTRMNARLSLAAVSSSAVRGVAGSITAVKALQHSRPFLKHSRPKPVFSPMIAKAVLATGLLSPQPSSSNENVQLVQSDSSQGHAFAKKDLTSLKTRWLRENIQHLKRWLMQAISESSAPAEQQLSVGTESKNISFQQPGMSTPLKKRRLTLEPFDTASDVFSSPEHDNLVVPKQQSSLSGSHCTTGSLMSSNLFERMSSEHANADTGSGVRRTAFPMSFTVERGGVLGHQLITKLLSSMQPFHSSRESVSENTYNTVSVPPSATVNVQSGAVTSTEPAASTSCDVDIKLISTDSSTGCNHVHASNDEVHSAGDLLFEAIITVDSTTDDSVHAERRSHHLGPCTPPDILRANDCEKEDGEISDDESDSKLMDSSVDCGEISSTNSSRLKSRHYRAENFSVSLPNVRGRSFKPHGDKSSDHEKSKWDMCEKLDGDKIGLKLAVKGDSSPLLWNNLGSPISSNSDSDIDSKIEEAMSKNQQAAKMLRSEQGYEHVERTRTRSVSSDVDSLISSSESCCKEDSYLASEEASIPAGKRKMSLAEYRNRQQRLKSKSSSTRIPAKRQFSAPSPVTVSISNSRLGSTSGDSHMAQWNSDATAAERLLDKPLSLTERLRFEFGVDAIEDSEPEDLPSASPPSLLKSTLPPDVYCNLPPHLSSDKFGKISSLVTPSFCVPPPLPPSSLLLYNKPPPLLPSKTFEVLNKPLPLPPPLPPMSDLFAEPPPLPPSPPPSLPPLPPPEHPTTIWVPARRQAGSMVPVQNPFIQDKVQSSFSYRGTHGRTISVDTALPPPGAQDCQPQYEMVPRQLGETASSIPMLPTDATKSGSFSNTDSSRSSFKRQRIQYEKFNHDHVVDHDASFSSSTGNDAIPDCNDHRPRFSCNAHETVPILQQNQWLEHESTSVSNSAGGNSSKPQVRPLMSISAVPTRNFSGVLPTGQRSSSEIETRRSSVSDENPSRKSSIFSKEAHCDTAGLHDVDYRLPNNRCDWEHSRSSGRSDSSNKTAAHCRTGHTNLQHQEGGRNQTRQFKSHYSPR